MKGNLLRLVGLICFWAISNTSADLLVETMRQIQTELREIRMESNEHLTRYHNILTTNHNEIQKERQEREQLRNKLNQVLQSVDGLKGEIRSLSVKVSELWEKRKEKYEQTEKIIKSMERTNDHKLRDLTNKTDKAIETSEKTFALLKSGKLKLGGSAGFDDTMLEKMRNTFMESMQISLHTFKGEKLNPEYQTMKEGVKQGFDDLKDTLGQIRPNCNDHSEEMKIILENNFKNLTAVLEKKVLDNAVVPNINVAVPNLDENPFNALNPVEGGDPFNAFVPAVRAPATTAEPPPCNRMSFIQDPKNCAELRTDGVTCDGVYPVVLHPEVGQRFVYCDMTTDGGGWTVIARRGDYGEIKTSFSKTWKTYKQGFGNIRKDFWFGNNTLNRLTSQESNHLRVKLEAFTGETLAVTYKDFHVGNLTDKFKLKIGDVIEGGDQAHFGQSLKSHDGQPFSTSDENNSGNAVNCGEKFKSGWWFQSDADQCFQAILTAPYFQEGEYREDKEGIIWQSWKQWQVLKAVEMKVRPANFEADAP